MGLHLHNRLVMKLCTTHALAYSVEMLVILKYKKINTNKKTTEVHIYGSLHDSKYVFDEDAAEATSSL